MAVCCFDSAKVLQQGGSRVRDRSAASESVQHEAAVLPLVQHVLAFQSLAPHASAPLLLHAPCSSFVVHQSSKLQ